MVSGTVSGFDRCARAQSELCRRSGDSPRLSREGKLELTEALRQRGASDSLSLNLEEWPRLPFTARIERAQFHRARSVSKKGTWPLLSSSF